MLNINLSKYPQQNQMKQLDENAFVLHKTNML